jgi:chemotaxis protein methyltransferase CheR
MTALAAAAAGLGEEDFRRFADFFYRRTGIVLGDGKRAVVERRVAERVRAGAASGPREYLSRLRLEPLGVEMQDMVNALTVNETYFYRESHQFQTLTDHVLPELVAARRRGATVRIWCMPCSTGEEPYSVAIWLLENWADVDAFEIEIHGSDIDTRVLEAARAGRYGRRALHRLTPALAQKYFIHDPVRDEFQLLPEIVGSIEFARINVLNSVDVARMRDVDVVFCRNMLIYFDDASRRQAVDNMLGVMRPGGAIFLGHSESMSRISPLFEPRRCGDAIVYRRPLQARHDR